MKISLERHLSAPPDMRWSAIDDGTYDGVPYEHADGRVSRSPMGWGATEAEAERDLLDLIEDRKTERQIAEEEAHPSPTPEDEEADRLAFERQHAWGKP